MATMTRQHFQLIADVLACPDLQIRLGRLIREWAAGDDLNPDDSVMTALDVAADCLDLIAIDYAGRLSGTNGQFRPERFMRAARPGRDAIAL